MQGVRPVSCLLKQTRCSYTTPCCWLSTSTSRQKKQNGGAREEGGGVAAVVDPQDVRCDCVGPADKQSNMRPLRFYVPPAETDLHRRYRDQRADTQKWNQHFWAQHNILYKKMKEEFIKVRLNEKYGPDTKERKTLSADEMSEFYKQFLDENIKVHSQYNREWYQKNISNLILAVRVWLQQKLHIG